MRRHLTPGRIVGALALAVLLACSSAPPSTDDGPGPTVDGTAAPSTTAAPERARITLAEFEALREGMTLAEAEAVVGGPGEVTGESKGGSVHLLQVGWHGERGLGANAQVMFEGDRLMSKVQMGLK